MKHRCLRNLAAATGLAALLPVSPALASDALVRAVRPASPVANPNVVASRTVRLDLAAADAFAIRAPDTGKPIAGSTILTLPNGRKISAQTYYQELNKHEAYLKGRGASLKVQSDDLGVVELAPATKKLLRDQTLNIRAQNVRDLAMADQDFDRVLVPLKPIIIPGVILPPPPPAEPTCDSNQTYTYNKPWSKTLGNSKFNVGVDASLYVRATCEQMRATGKGKARGTAFGYGYDFLRGEVDGRASDTAGSDLAVKVYLAKWKILDSSSHFNTTIDRNYHRSKSFDLGGSYRFVIGPIPVKVSYGVEGKVGLRYGYRLSPLNAKAYVKPYGQVDAYLKGGIDALIAGGGVAGRLELLDVALKAYGNAAFAVKNYKPYLYARAALDYNIDALDGEISAYVFVYVPRWGIPPWKKKTYSKTITSWDGLHAQGTLADLEKWVLLI